MTGVTDLEEGKSLSKEACSCSSDHRNAGLRDLFICLFVSLHSQVLYTFLVSVRGFIIVQSKY